jgi:rhamnose utilization protein RhaD (predicted bifunctional aldolase and dehydrogenase)
MDAMINMHHGIFTFADDAKTSYEKMIGYVNRAESYIQDRIRNKPLLTRRPDLTPPKNDPSALARFLRLSGAHVPAWNAGANRAEFYVRDPKRNRSRGGFSFKGSPHFAVPSSSRPIT